MGKYKQLNIFFRKKILQSNHGTTVLLIKQNHSKSAILLKIESTSGVTIARFLSSPKTQQHLSTVLMATAS